MKKNSAGLWSHINLPTTYALGNTPKSTEHSFGVSQTVPDQALTLTELLYRQTRGLPIPMKNAVYTDEILPDLRKLDLSEIAELKEQARSNVDRLRKELQEAEATERQRVTDERNALLEQQRAERSRSQNNPREPLAASQQGAEQAEGRSAT